ncbi:MAG: PrsW family intramembrane metalloprotease [Candidatus Limnocylindrales bacterium]
MTAEEPAQPPVPPPQPSPFVPLPVPPPPPDNPASSMLARTLHDSPLRRPLVGLAVVVVLLLLAALAVVVHAISLEGQPLAAVAIYMSAFGLALVCSLPALALLWYLDRHERESPWLFAAALAWGGFVATGLALLLNTLVDKAVVARLQGGAAGPEAGQVDPGSAVLAFLAVAVVLAPIIEECLKALAVLAIFWLLRNEFNGVRDGIVFGALVGLGFNALEVAFYVLNGYLDTGHAPFGQQFVVRFVFLGLNGHVVFTALFGAGLGLARQTQRRWLKVGAPVGGLLLAILAHQASNLFEGVLISLWLVAIGTNVDSFEQVPLPSLWLGTVIANVLILALPLLLLGWAIVWSGRWERRVIREGLDDEVGQAITPREHDLLVREPAYGLRTVPGYPRREARAIVHAQNELAFRKWQVRRTGGDPTWDPVAGAWRADIARLRASRST